MVAEGMKPKDVDAAEEEANKIAKLQMKDTKAHDREKFLIKQVHNVNETSSSVLDLHYKVVELAEIYNFVVEVEI